MKKKIVHHEQAWDEYCKFMNGANLEKQKNYTESPHIVIRRSLYLVEDNSIILRSPTVSEDTSFHRNIYYEIEKLGNNIKIHSTNKKILWKIKEIFFFYEFGKRMETVDIEKQKNLS